MRASAENCLVRVLGSITVALLLTFGSTTANASGGGGTWLTQKLIGVKNGSWISVQTVVRYPSYYRYDTKVDMHVTNARNGCILQRASLGEYVSRDTSAQGTWQSKVKSNRDAGAPQILAQAIPLIGAFEREEISIRAGALTLKYGEKHFELVSKARIKRWAKLLGIELSDEVRIVDVSSPAAFISGAKLSFLELETLHRTIDQDYIRFVVPIEIGKVMRLIDKGVVNRAVLQASQPAPTGC